MTLNAGTEYQITRQTLTPVRPRVSASEPANASAERLMA